MEDRLPRRLAAILYADVAGYSRLTVDDEDATHRILSRYLDFIAETIGFHNGQIMHYAGDAVLARFDAVVDALASAIGIQQQIDKLNRELPAQRRIQFRIGLNLGDVIEDRGDIYGDGVNIAARLESLADPGGICVSEAVRTAAKSRLDLEYEAMGEQELKNIPEPVSAYRVRFDSAPLGEREQARYRHLAEGLSIELSANEDASGAGAEESSGDDFGEAPTRAIPDAASGRFRVADWLVDPQLCTISRDGETVKLEPKVMDLLVYLASSPGQVHARDELLEQVWSGTIVSDEALTNAIIKLRKAFGDSARNPRIVETLSKRGYRLVASVGPIDAIEADSDKASGESTNLPASAAIARPALLIVGVAAIGLLVLVGSMLMTGNGARDNPDDSAKSMPLPDQPSIAVLPFVNTSNELEYNYFSDGISEDLITDLSSLSGLFVISRNSTFQYKGMAVDPRHVARELGVRYVLEGSVRRSGDLVRVNAQLIDGLSGGQLWADRYDGKLQNVFQLQDRITAQIIAALALKLSDKDARQLARVETNVSEAYDEFLKGWGYRWRVSRDSFARAERHFLRALELDPEYARPHAALALIYWNTWQQQWHANSGATSGGWIRARRELEAIADKPLPLAYSLRSAMSLHNRKFDQALRQAQTSIDLNPGDPTGYLALAEVQSYSDLSEAAIQNAKKGLRLDPNFPAPYLFVEGRALFDLKRYDEAVATLKRAVTASPANYDPLVILTAAYGYLGRWDEAERIIARLNELLTQDRLPEFSLGSLRNRWPYRSREARTHLVEGIRNAGVPEW